MIQIGDTVNRRISVYDASRGPKPVTVTVPAMVVYVHPECRYYVVRCDMPQGRSFCEALYFFPRCGME